MRLECGNLRNARSPRGGDPETALPTDKLTFTLTFTRPSQTTPYLITLICILSTGAHFNVIFTAFALCCATIICLFKTRLYGELQKTSQIT